MRRPTLRQRGQFFPKRQNSLDSSVGRELHNVSTARANHTVRPQNRNSMVCRVHECVEAGGNGEPTTWPVYVKAIDLLGDLAVSHEEAVGPPNLGRGRHGAS